MGKYIFRRGIGKYYIRQINLEKNMIIGNTEWQTQWKAIINY